MTTNDPGKPQTIDDVFNTVVMNENEQAALESDTYEQLDEQLRGKKAEGQAEAAPAPVEEGQKALPPWVQFPAGFKVPPFKEVFMLQFRAKWTDRPDLGDRWCVLWTLSTADEKLAVIRSRGQQGRGLEELSKQMVRLIDGKRADWTMTGDPDTTYDVSRFWNEIGPKCRQQIQNIYLKTHALSKTEQDDFFENCLVVRKAAR